MRFQAGQSGNPGGRPKGSYGGRIQALATLDKLMARRKNQRLLLEALDTKFREDPVRFFKTVIMPLLPTAAKVSFDRAGAVQWKSLVGLEGDGAPEVAALGPAQGSGDGAAAGPAGE